MAKSSEPYFRASAEDWPAFVDSAAAVEIWSLWEVPAAAQLLWVLSDLLKLPPFSLRDFEFALLDPSSSALLGEIVTKLLIPDNAPYEFQGGDKLP